MGNDSAPEKMKACKQRAGGFDQQWAPSVVGTPSTRQSGVGTVRRIGWSHIAANELDGLLLLDSSIPQSEL
eukprot:4299073-Amphidinium_carterae.1